MVVVVVVCVHMHVGMCVKVYVYVVFVCVCVYACVYVYLLHDYAMSIGMRSMKCGLESRFGVCPGCTGGQRLHRRF